MIIWILDCSNGCVTRVNLSSEMQDELDRFLEDGGDTEAYIRDHEATFGVCTESSVWMTTNDEHVYEVDY